MGYRVEFYASVIVMVMLTAVGWKTLTLDNLIVPDEVVDGGRPVAVMDNGHV